MSKDHGDPAVLFAPRPGRGVYLMRQFMDEVNFSFPDVGGTRISLVKRLPAVDGADG